MIPYAVELDEPRRSDPIVALIALNAAAFAARLAWPQEAMSYAFVPASREPLTWLTAQFLHADFWHLASNMYALWLFGPHIAYRVGKWLAPLYLAGGVAANLLHAMSDLFSRVPAVGASGAVAALIGAFVVAFPDARLKFYHRGAGRPYGRGVHFSLSPLAFAGLWLLVEGMGVLQGDDGVAHWAHLGGFFFGVGVGAAMPKAGSAAGRMEEASGLVAAARAAFAAGDDAAAARLFLAGRARDPGFALPADADQIELGKALFRAGLPHWAAAALEKAARRAPEGPDAPRALVLLGDIELTRFKEYAAALAAYEEAAASPGADERTRNDARVGAGRARAALSDDAPAGAGRLRAVLFEARPPLAPAQLEAVRRACGGEPGPLTGFLARGLPPEAAAAAARELEAAGVPAVAVPEEGLVGLGPPQPAEALRFDETGLGPDGGARVPYEELLLVAVTWVAEVAYEREGPGLVEYEGRSSWDGDEGGPEPLAPLSREVLRARPVLDAVTRGGRRVRLSPHAGAEDEILPALDEILRRAPQARLEWGARALLAGERPAWARFDGQAGADAYLHWQLQLAALKSRADYGRPGGLR